MAQRAMTDLSGYCVLRSFTFRVEAFEGEVRIGAVAVLVLCLLLLLIIKLSGRRRRRYGRGSRGYGGATYHGRRRRR